MDKHQPNKSQIINRLSQFGEGYSHHHEDYEQQSIALLRNSRGSLKAGAYIFHFPEHFGFCYGVDKAIDLVFETCKRFKGKNVYLTDQLIHNPVINQKLRDIGVRYLERGGNHLLQCSHLQAQDVVVVSAFGTDFRDILALQAVGVTIVDSTCGAIINVWKRVEGYAKDGFITMMHGKRNHEETKATVSQALKHQGQFIIIETVEEAVELAEYFEKGLSSESYEKQHPGSFSSPMNLADVRLGMANQTTMLKGESLRIQQVLREAFERRYGSEEVFKRFRSFDTICGATQDRQDALRQLLAKKIDILLVVGGFNSSNTTHLAEIAHGKVPYFHIEDEAHILSKTQIQCRDPLTGWVSVVNNWLPSTVSDIGITSGASTPDMTLFNIIKKIETFS